MKKFTLTHVFILTSFLSYTQSITKLTSPEISGTVCPVSDTFYEVNVPSHLTSCEIVWSATNGTVTRDKNNQRKAKVEWNDQPGAKGKVTATFTNCSEGANNGVKAELEELILSVKNQAVGSYQNAFSVNFCSKPIIRVSIPKMYVQGTGGSTNIPHTETVYDWKLPSGWREIGLGKTGEFVATTNFLDIEPINCSLPGVITVKGVIKDKCSSSAESQTATITLNGISTPSVTVVPQSGFTGVRACNTNNVTFTGSVSSTLSCQNPIDWVFPPSWTEVSRNSNSITLKPSGTPDDSGNIRAILEFSCGTKVNSANYKPPFIQPSITGTNFVCSTTTFGISNASTSAVSWSSSNTTIMTINPSTGFANRQGRNKGQVIIHAEFSCGAPSVYKAVWVGEPAISNHVIWTPPISNYNVNPITLGPYAEYNFYFSDNQGVGVPGATEYIWNLPSGFTLFSSNINTAIIRTSINQGVYELSSSARNVCGSGGARALTINVESGGGGGVIMVIQPNPASDEIEVGLDDNKGLEPGKNPKGNIIGKYLEYFIYDQIGNEVLTGTFDLSNKIDVRNLEKGVYLLKVIDGEKHFSKRLLIQR